MSCCGRLRQQLGTTRLPTGAEPSKSIAPPPRQLTVVFEYTGATALSVLGPVTHRRYRFEHTGARLVVDPRDRAGLAAVPGLRQLTN